jgi:hypothetical protein
VPASSVVLRALLSVAVLYISSQSSFIYLAVIPAFISVTQDGAGSPPPLVEVNQAILAWSFRKKIEKFTMYARNWRRTSETI